MASTDSSPRRSASPRWLRRARNLSVCVLLCTPLAAGIWDVHIGQGSGVWFREVPALDHSRTEADRALAERVAEYRRQRLDVIDRLLPDGHGGTRFYESLHGMAGMAFVGSTAIGISASSSLGPWVGEVELHERGHLVHAFLPVEAGRLLARLPAPLPDELAADDPGQHFAEMPATAWEVIAGFLTSPVDATMCFAPPDVAMLEDAERRVPGTAGFVARFLERLGPTTDRLDAAAAIHDAARDLSAPYGAELDAVWARIEERRQAGGTFEPWSIRSVRDHIETHRTHLWHSERLWEKAISVVYLPGLAVAAVVGL